LKFEEEADACKGEGKLVVGTVGVVEERVVALASSRRDKSFWTRWLLLLGSWWQRRKIL
jgi:hypothetical protein